MKRIVVAVIALAMAACGSQWNLPFSQSNPTLPSSINIGSNGHDARAAAANDLGRDAVHPFLWPHLVTWHRLNAATGETSWTKVNTHPLFWPQGYDSLDQSVMVQLNGMMAARNMAPLASWWGVDAIAGDAFLDAYLPVQSPVKVGILYEVGDCLAGKGLLLFDSSCHVPFDGGTLGTENRTRFTADMAHLTAKYFNGPHGDRFLRVNGKVVVFIWLTGAFRGDFASVAKAVRAQYPVYLVASDVNLYNPGRDGLLQIIGGMDAVSAYGIAEDELAPTGHMDAAYAARYAQALTSWSQWLHANAPSLTLIPPIMFAYDDSGIPGRANTPVITTPDEARAMMETLYTFIAAARQTCSNVAPGALAVSLNEDYEGSSLYPTQEHGDAYFSILQEFAGRTLPAASCR